MLQRASDYEEPDLATAAVWAREHAVFVDEVFTWFLRVGKWPTVNDLQQWLDQHDQNLNVVALAQDMPRVLGSHWRGPDGELKLGIRGLRTRRPGQSRALTQATSPRSCFKPQPYSCSMRSSTSSMAASTDGIPIGEG